MYRINIIRYPSGRYGYVGRVPADLAVECTKGYEDRAYDIAAHVGMDMAKKIAKNEGWEIKTRTFATDTEAESFATQHSYKVLHSHPATC